MIHTVRRRNERWRLTHLGVSLTSFHGREIFSHLHTARVHTLSIVNARHNPPSNDELFWLYERLMINPLRYILATSRNDYVEPTAGEIEDEDRILLFDMKTSYVPVDAHRIFQRRKRNIDRVLDLRANSNRKITRIIQHLSSFPVLCVTVTFHYSPLLFSSFSFLFLFFSPRAWRPLNSLWNELWTRAARKQTRPKATRSFFRKIARGTNRYLASRTNPTIKPRLCCTHATI